MQKKRLVSTTNPRSKEVTLSYSIHHLLLVLTIKPDFPY